MLGRFGSGKMFLYFAGFVSLIFVGLINFDEELLFLLTFITIVFVGVSFVGHSLALQLDLAISSIVKEFAVLASAKSISLYSIKEYSLNVSNLYIEIADLALYTQEFVHSSVDAHKKELNGSFQLLKHKQLKLLVLEGLQFTKLLYVRGFLNYWKELKNTLASSNFGETMLLPASEKSEFSSLVVTLRRRLALSPLISLISDYDNNPSVITYVDYVLLVMILSIFFDEFYNHNQ